MRILQLIVSPEDAGKAIRAVVPRRLHLGNHEFRRLKAQGAIRVNGTPVHASTLLSAGDRVEVALQSDEGAAPIPTFPDGSMIRYMDEDMLLLCKPAPMATLPAGHIGDPSLREALCALLQEDPGAFVYHPVNRLDKGTSGLMAVARHAHAQRLLTKQLHTSAFEREYLAVTEGIPAQDSGVIDAPIARLGAGARRGVTPGGKPSVTHYSVLQTNGRRALLRLRLETGRTHQIRVHLAHIGCPIAGDYLYGSPLPQLPDRFALHSFRLRCRQPITGESIEREVPLPPELAALLDA